MRIVSGVLRGRIFNAPSGHRTHPMGDKIRGALFNVLGDIQGLTVLDAFAGSGALSFEAISRGAASALAIDVDKEAYQTIVKNIDQLGLTKKVVALRKNAAGWSRNNQHRKFDIVLVDQPYNDIRPALIQTLANQVEDGGILVLSWPREEPVRDFDGVTQLSTKNYAGATLVFYRKLS